MVKYSIHRDGHEIGCLYAESDNHAEQVLLQYLGREVEVQREKDHRLLVVLSLGLGVLGVAGVLSVIQLWISVSNYFVGGY